MKRILLTIYLLLPLAVWGDTHTADSNSAADINSAISAASDGDVVVVPNGNGTVTWTDTITIPNTKGITIKGPGTNTPKSSASFPLVVTSNQSTAIQINLENNNSATRITGFKFLGSPSGEYIKISGQGRGKTPYNGAYRIDNCWFYQNVTSSAIHIWSDSGETTGVIDNCTFEDLSDDNYIIRIREIYTGGHTGAYGYDAWTRDFSFGSSRFNFVEDCYFKQANYYMRHYVACDGAGGKYVVRHNVFESTKASTYPDYIDAHGDGTPGLGTGSRGGEIYSNEFKGSDSTVGRDINIRGGQFLIYDNTFTTLGYGTSPINFTEYRASVDDSSQISNQSPLDEGVPTYCDNTVYATYHPLPCQIQGTYVWNNVYSSTDYSPAIATENYVSTYIVDGTDFWHCDDLADAKSKGLSSSYAAFNYPHPLRAEPTTRYVLVTK